MSGILLLWVVVSVVVSRNTRHYRAAVLSFVLFLVMLIVHDPLYDRLYEKMFYMVRYRRVPPFARSVENRSGVIAVTRKQQAFGNGAYDGVFNVSLTRQVNYEIDNAYLLFLFHPRPRDILQIGLATGSWAQVIVHGPGVRSLTAVEINPGYLKLIPQYPSVRTLLKNPKFKVFIDDGRRWLRRFPDLKYDVVILNTTFHWRSHATDLLSEEFMYLLKRHLNPGGIIYLNTTGSKHAIRTVARQFKYVLRYRIYIIASDAPICPDRIQFREIMKAYKIDGKPVFDLRNQKEKKIFNSFVRTHFYDPGKNLFKKTEGKSVITDDNMVTEFNFIRKYILRTR